MVTAVVLIKAETDKVSELAEKMAELGGVPKSSRSQDSTTRSSCASGEQGSRAGDLGKMQTSGHHELRRDLVRVYSKKDRGCFSLGLD
jgi:hypothetical protein